MFDAALKPLGVPARSAYQVVTAGVDGLFTVLLAGRALRGISADAALGALEGHQTLRRLVRSARFRGLAVDAEAEPYTTARGKSRFFVHQEEQP
jgi:phenylacetate-CoA ligase